jgi:hypothetical protein
MSRMNFPERIFYLESYASVHLSMSAFKVFGRRPCCARHADDTAKGIPTELAFRTSRPVILRMMTGMPRFTWRTRGKSAVFPGTKWTHVE